VPFLFDTDALSEVMRRAPNAQYLAWLRKVSREDQFTSAVTVGELFQGAYRSDRREALLTPIEQFVLPAVTVLDKRGLSPGDADVQIAATAIRHGLALVTGNVRHHRRVPGLKLERILADARRMTGP
jgi:predicted nucleic acid-binding protein